MPVTLSYPGVYVTEVSSGVHTITGVATSIAAFVGSARRGPVNAATVINSFGDFERIFGGLWAPSLLGFAVEDFFSNGGGQAVVVRLFHASAGNATARFAVSTLSLRAASEGKWGGALEISVDLDPDADVAKRLGVAPADLFNLTITDTATGTKERFLNLTVTDSSRRVDKVLAGQSNLVLWDGDPYSQPASTPLAGADDVTALRAAAAKAGAELVKARQVSPPNPAAVAAAQTAFDTANTAYTAVVPADSDELTKADFTPPSGQEKKRGLYALENADLFNMLVIPPYKGAAPDIDVDDALWADAAKYCEDRRAMLLIESKSGWRAGVQNALNDYNANTAGTVSKNAALFYPRYRKRNSLHDNRIEEFPSCGAVAGVFARTDGQRGVWKAPAGLDATLLGVPELTVPLTDLENGQLNLVGINCLRAMPAAGRVVWGSRTLQGNDRLSSEWKYIPVRRTALFIEESLYRGTHWIVFEPNDEPLWAQIRLNIGAFMNSLFRQGAFQGSTPREAYFVKCDKETTTQADIDLGIVNIVVGFAPLKPAEFVVIQTAADGRSNRGLGETHAESHQLSRRLYRGDSQRRPNYHRRSDFDHRLRRPAARGPVDEPIMINGYADYERTSEASATHQSDEFRRSRFLSQRRQHRPIIVRLYQPKIKDPAARTAACHRRRGSGVDAAAGETRAAHLRRQR